MIKIIAAIDHDDFLYVIDGETYLYDNKEIIKIESESDINEYLKNAIKITDIANVNSLESAKFSLSIYLYDLSKIETFKAAIELNPPATLEERILKVRTLISQISTYDLKVKFLEYLESLK